VTDVAVVLIVAVAENGAIGAGGAMPWRLKSDLRRFRELTIGKPVLMGRKTFHSIGRALPGRTNIVVTRDPGFRAAGVVVVPSVGIGLDVARSDALRRFATEIAVIGGAEIYRQTIDVADRIEQTEVHASPQGDTFFKAIDPAAWEEVARRRVAASPEDSADFSYLTYRRRLPP
jgi:dihydrofolate reductase